MPNLADMDVVLGDPRRLAALRRTTLVHAPAEAAFDRLTRLAARVLRAPISLVTLLDDKEQFFFSSTGLPPDLATSRGSVIAESYCKYTVEKAAPFVVTDARLHPQLRDNPLLLRHHFIAYAGVALVTSDGFALGALCVIDVKPRQWTQEDVAILEELAASVMTEIELRTMHDLERQAQDSKRRSELLERVSTVLGESLSEHEEGLRRAAQYVVPMLADACDVHLLRDAGFRRIATVAPSNGTRVPRSDEDVLSEVIQRREPVITPTSIGVPIRARGEFQGVLVLQSRGRSRPYDEHDLLLAGEVAVRMGHALENAQLHDALRESERRFQSLANDAPVGIFISSEEGGCIYVNRRMLALSGHTDPNVVLGRGWLNILHPEDAAQLSALLPGRTRLRRAFDDQIRVIRPDGRIVWCHVSASFVPAGDGRFLMIGSMDDITHAVLAKQERERSLEIQTFLADAAKELASSFDYRATLARVIDKTTPKFADASVVLVGDEDEKVTLVSAHDLPDAWVAQAQAWLSLEPFRTRGPGDEPLLVANVGADDLKRLASDAPTLNALEPLTLRTFILMPLRLLDERNAFLLLARVGPDRPPFDAADLHFAEALGQLAAMAVLNGRLYEASEDAVRMRNEFLSVASHELKTPLTTLQLQLSRIPTMMAAPERQMRAVESARRQAHRLNKLILNLLDVSRFEGGQLQLEFETFDLADVIRELVTRMQEDAMRAGSRIALFAPKHLVGRWDKVRIEQVASNLLSNAIKYGGGNPVEVTLSAQEDRVRLSVEDHGVGIAPDAAARIFDKFERAVSSRHFGGLGLGLYIARQLAEAHGGTIDVSSVPGQGSIFTFIVPQWVAAANGRT